MRRLELTRERERLRLLLVQLSLQPRDWFFGLLRREFPPLSHLRVHVRALRLEQLLLLLELTHQLALQHEEIVLLLLELLVLGEPGVVRLFLQALHLFLVVRLELGDAGLLPSDLRLALGDQALLLLQGVIGLLRVGPVRDDGGVQSLQLRVPVLEELEVVPEILRELRELLLGLGELLLADRELLLDVLRALVDLVHALLGERDELLWSLFEGAHLGGQRSALRSGGSWIIVVRSISRMRTFSFCAMRLRMLVGGVGAITMCPAPSLTGVVYALIPDTTDDTSGRPGWRHELWKFAAAVPSVESSARSRIRRAPINRRIGGGRDWKDKTVKRGDKKFRASGGNS